jgi:hypothetical protein
VDETLERRRHKASHKRSQDTARKKQTKRKGKCLKMKREELNSRDERPNPYTLKRHDGREKRHD